MGVFIGIVLFLLIAGSLILGVFSLNKGKFFSRGGRKEPPSKSDKIKAAVFMSVAGVFLIMFIFVPFGFKTVETGEIAVVKVWGEAKELKNPGLHFMNIISTKYEIYDLKTQQMDIDDEVYTADAQPLMMKLTVQYSIQTDKVLEINRTYGQMETLATRIKNIALEKSKVILSAKDAMKLIETRAALSPDVLTEIKTIEAQYFINIENVAIVDMAFSAAFEQAVEQKMIEQQAVERAKAEAERANIKAQEELDVSKLQAAQAIERAAGQAEAQIEIARGEAQALKLKSIEAARLLGFIIKEVEVDGGIDYEIDFENSDPDIEKTSIISDYLKFIAYLEAWDGKLPEVVGEGVSILWPMP
ncbi:MAG: prohibitin family protein [Firmicutes bacterium]|nr:prohibitin family protein [Bacillota bacterium]